jgi:hypothetical protein
MKPLRFHVTRPRLDQTFQDAETWFEENDRESVAFEYDVLGQE